MNHQITTEWLESVGCTFQRCGAYVDVFDVDGKYFGFFGSGAFWGWRSKPRFRVKATSTPLTTPVSCETIGGET